MNKKKKLSLMFFHDTLPYKIHIHQILRELLTRHIGLHLHYLCKISAVIDIPLEMNICNFYLPISQSM